MNRKCFFRKNFDGFFGSTVWCCAGAIVLKASEGILPTFHIYGTKSRIIVPYVWTFLFLCVKMHIHA